MYLLCELSSDKFVEQDIIIDENYSIVIIQQDEPGHQETDSGIRKYSVIDKN